MPWAILILQIIIRCFRIFLIQTLLCTNNTTRLRLQKTCRWQRVWFMTEQILPDREWRSATLMSRTALLRGITISFQERPWSEAVIAVQSRMWISIILEACSSWGGISHINSATSRKSLVSWVTMVALTPLTIVTRQRNLDRALVEFLESWAVITTILTSRMLRYTSISSFSTTEMDLHPMLVAQATSRQLQTLVET